MIFEALSYVELGYYKLHVVRGPSGDVEKLYKLKSLIASFVHVHKGTILHYHLHGMSRCALYLRRRSQQKQLLGVAETLVNALQKKHLVALLSVHPSMLLDVPVVKNKELFPDISQLGCLKLNPEDGSKTMFIVVELHWLSEAVNEKIVYHKKEANLMETFSHQLARMD